jgi:DNA repair protein RecO
MYFTPAIILKKDISGEADLLVSAFTENYGKIRLLAQGARKDGAKLKGHLEPGTYALFAFVAGKNMYRLTEADTIEMFPNIAQSFQKMKARAWIFNFAERTTMEDLRGEAGDFFSALVKFLRELEAVQEGAFRIRFLVLRAEFALYRYLGILPDAAPRLHEAFDEGTIAQAEIFSRTISEQELRTKKILI